MALTTDPVISPRRSVFRRTAIPVGGVGRAAAGWGRRYAFRLLLVDLLGLLVAALVVHLTRFPPVGVDGAIDRNLVPFVALTAVLVIVWMLALAWSGSRDPTTIGYGAVEYQRVIQATFTVFGVAAIASYLLKVDLPRSYLLVMMPVGLAALLAARFGCRRWLHRQRDTGRYLSRVLAVGTIDTVTALLRDLRWCPTGRLPGDRRVPERASAFGRRRRRPAAGHRWRPGARWSGHGHRRRPAPTPSRSPPPLLSARRGPEAVLGPGRHRR